MRILIVNGKTRKWYLDARVFRNSRTGDTERYSGTNTPEIMDLISQNLFNYLFNDSSARKKSVRFLVFVDKHYVDYVPKYNRSINHASCWKHHAKERRWLISRNSWVAFGWEAARITHRHNVMNGTHAKIRVLIK